MTSVTNINDIRDKVYKYKNVNEQIKSEAQEVYWVEKMEINNGMYSYVMGMEYPEKGVVSAQDIYNCNMVKRVIIESLKLSKYFLPSIIAFVFLPCKLKVKIVDVFIHSFREFSFKIMSTSILQHQHLTPMAQELHKFAMTFCKEIGLKDTYDIPVDVIINIINFDNAYRYRLQDLFYETTKEALLDRPIREFYRLLKIHNEREVLMNQVKKKFMLFFIGIVMCLLHPKVRRAYKKAMSGLNLKRVQPDEADKFWMCVRENYNYFGKTNAERKMAINHLKYVVPTKLST